MTDYTLANPTETRDNMISAGKRQLAAWERRFAKYEAQGYPQLISIAKGSMGYSMSLKLANGEFKVAGEAA